MAKNLLKNMLKEYKRTPGLINTKDLIERIEAGYLVDNKNGFKKKKTFSPSSLVYGHGACPRYWYLAFHGTEFHDEVTSRQVANMRNGTLSHERIQKAIEDSGIMISKESKIINADPPIFGYQDVEVELNGAAVPGEIKTCNDRSFELRKESGRALPYHIAQLAIYMRIREKENGVIIYENKNTHELLVVPVEANDEINAWVDKLFDWCRDVKKASDEDTLPKKQLRSNSKICKSCPVREACDSLAKDGVDIPMLEQLS